MPGKPRGKGRPFVKGQSGNPAGMKPGLETTAHKMRKLLAPHAPALVAKAVEIALKGDVAALRICMDKLIPNLRTEKVAMPFLAKGTLTEKGDGVIGELERGGISAPDALAVLQLLSIQGKVSEMDSLEIRLKELEDKAQAST